MPNIKSIIQEVLDLDEKATKDWDIYIHPETLKYYRTVAPKLAKVCLEMEKFIRGKLVCLGERHDCPSCNGVDAEEVLAEIDKIVREG